MLFYLGLHRFGFETIEQGLFNIPRMRQKGILFSRHCLKTRGFSLYYTSSVLRHLSSHIIRITCLEL